MTNTPKSPATFIVTVKVMNPMIPSSEQKIKEEWGYAGRPKVWQLGFDSALKERAELLPIINQQQEEIEKLKAELKHWEDRFDALVGERSADMAGNKVITLQSRFDGLLKELEKMEPRRMYDRYGEYGESESVFLRYDIQSIIKQARGE